MNHLNTALADLTAAIEDATLGPIESAVIDAACRELICNWNDHLDKGEGDEPIDEVAALAEWVASSPHANKTV